MHVSHVFFFLTLIKQLFLFFNWHLNHKTLNGEVHENYMYTNSINSCGLAVSEGITIRYVSFLYSTWQIITGSLGRQSLDRILATCSHHTYLNWIRVLFMKAQPCNIEKIIQGIARLAHFYSLQTHNQQIRWPSGKSVCLWSSKLP